MKPHFSFAFIALAGVAMAAPAVAQDSDGGRQEGSGPVARGHGKASFLETYDANGDGKVTKAEFLANRTTQFEDLDLNRNEGVNELEYVAEYTLRLDKELAEQRGRQIRQAHFRFGVLDTDKDGLLSAAEFGESGDRMFTRLDTNGDGVVDEKDTAKSF